MNKEIFSSRTTSVAPDAVNNAGGTAYALSDKEALGQLVCTGTFNNTYYTSGTDQLDQVINLMQRIANKPGGIGWLVKLALYARNEAYMKDTPAVILAFLHGQGIQVTQSVFDYIINNGRMLRNFVQAVRSNQFGRRSFGSNVKKKVQRWINERSVEQLLHDSIGNNPSIADIIKMFHPRPESVERAAFYAYLIGQPHSEDDLPQLIKDYKAFVYDPSGSPIPNVPFQMLSSVDSNTSVWKNIARNAGWHMLRMNLNTFKRHGVLDDPEMVVFIANRLRDRDYILRSQVFPYQLMMAFNAASDVPRPIREALQDAMEIACENVPSFEGRTAVFVDVSASMSDPVTGYRGSATSKVTCVDIAALFASVILRKNSDAKVFLFDTDLHSVEIDPRDTITTNSNKMRLRGGGTNCSVPMKHVLDNQECFDNIIYISDNESWAHDINRYGGNTVKYYWDQYVRQINKSAKLICVDIAPYTTSQAPTTHNCLNIGGFSDNIFTNIFSFTQNNKTNWNTIIRRIEIPK